MIMQPFPLYAVDTRDNSTYTVIGWQEHGTGGVKLPLLAAMQGPGQAVTVAEPMQARHLTYDTARPELFYRRRVDPDQTVTMPRVSAVNPR